MTNVLLQNQLVNHMNCRSLLFWEIYCMCTLRCKYQICTILLVIFATVNNTNRNSNRPIWIQKRSEHCQTDRIHVWSMVYLPIYISLIFMGFDVGKYTIPHGWYGSHTPIIHINSHGFRLTKPEPGPSTPGQALLGCVSDDPYLFRTFVRVVQPAPRLFWETQILSRLWGFLKNGDIEVTIVCIYIYFFFTCMHTWNICTRKADGTGWNIQFQLVVFFWASESPESTVGEFPPGVDWSQKIRTPKDWIWNSRKRVRPWFHGFPTDKLTPTFWKRFTTGPTFFFFGIFKP